MNPARIAVVAVATAVSCALTAASLAGEGKSKFNKVLAVGDAAPKFEKLPGADGTTKSLSDYEDAKVVVVCFASTLCNVVTIYEERFVDFAKEYGPKGVKFVAISCERRGGLLGDVESAEESQELERIRARVKEHGIPYDYLYDASQKTGRAYGALNTPVLFVLDGERKVAYLGAFDDSFPADGVEERYVRDAVDAVLKGETPPERETLARGCRIEYAR